MKYICDKSKDFFNDKEVYTFVQKSFKDLNVKDVKGSYLTFLICLFAYVCYPFSLNELALFLGSYMGSSKVSVRVSELVKKGYLKEYSFDDCQDMNSRKAYYLSPQKQRELISLLPVDMANGANKYRKTNGRVPMHDYGIGMSLLQFMLLERPFGYNKEVSYSVAYLQRKEKGSLCVDAVIHMEDDDSTYYIEQDMGTEGISVLCGKLYAYEKNGIHRNRGALLISSHIPSPFSKSPSYHLGNLKVIARGMEEEMMDLHTYYECEKDILDEKILLTLKALIEKVNSPLNEDGYFGNRGGVWGYDELNVYIESLSQGRNLYRIKEYNQEQLVKATGRFRGMCSLLCGYIRRGAFDKPEIRFLLSGFPCLYYPTTLLSRCMDYLSFKDRGAVELVLSRYFQNMSLAGYKKGGRMVEIENEPSVAMNNVYEFEDGTLVVADYIGIDVSAFIRFYYLYYMRRYIHGRICLVGIGTKEDILFMCEHFVYYPSYGTGIADQGITLCFINEEKPEHLCIPYKRGEGDVILVDIEDREQKEKRESKQNAFHKLSKEQRAGMSKMEIAKAMGIIDE